MKKALLSLAGFDPTGGAGVLLDCKVFKLLGFQSLGIITANTVQNTQKVKEFFPIPSELIIKQFNTLQEDIKIEGIKIGMIGSKQSCSGIKHILVSSKNIHRIIDPILKAGSGKWLINKNEVNNIYEELIPLTEIITPNIFEASLLTEIKINSIDDMKKAAERIYNKWKVKSIIKGGHLKSDRAVDLAFDGENFLILEEKKIRNQVHGTGCFFSSALLGYLCLNKSFFEACKSAKELTFHAIKKSIKIGKGQKVILSESLSNFFKISKI